MSRMLFAAAAAALLAGPAWAGSDPAIESGRMLAIAGNCTACHTAPEGKPFAGGLPMQTPIGAVYATNITPSPTGIAGWSFAEFDAAMRKGVSRDGHRLYPAMPFPSYSKITEPDMKALYAYFMNGVEPVDQPNKPADIPWPLSMRWPLAIWSLVYAPDQVFRPSAAHDAAWNRGAYLVEGLGHCGSCHTPRGIGFQEKATGAADGGDFLAGASIDGWFAKSLRNDKGIGLGDWSEAEVADFLKTGRTDRTAAFGGMVEVISHSTQHLPDADVAAMAKYLKSLPPAAPRDYVPKTGDTTYADLRKGDIRRPGAAVYGEFCQSCHRADGNGFPRVFPALAGNSTVVTDSAESLVRVVLTGGRMPVTDDGAMAFAMPGFRQLSDAEVADVLTFVRSSWGNAAPPVSAKEVAKMRDTAGLAPARP